MCDISENEILENDMDLEEIDKSNNIFVYSGTYKYPKLKIVEVRENVVKMVVHIIRNT